jgi:hypothetical protein
MDAQAVAAASNLSAIKAVIFDLTVAGVALIVYLGSFLARRRQGPATGAVVDVFIDAAVITGALSVFVRLLNEAFLTKLSAEEHIITAIGCIALSFVLLKRFCRNMRIAWSKKQANKEPATEDSYDKPAHPD